MIQIYEPNNTNFDMNGDEVLTPSLCDAAAELCGIWTLDMTHPIDDDGRWKRLVKEAVVSVPTFMGKKQLYRIDEIDKQDTEITVKAYPVFFDSADEVFLMDTRPTGKSGQQALDIMTAGTKYSGESNITAVNTAYFIRRNLMNAINGDSPSFVRTWGGEPVYDNFKVIINERAGGDYGAEVRYGKNMNAVSVKEDMSEVVTRIVPAAFNGRTLSSGYVDSPLINNYAKIYTREIVFEDVKYIEDVTGSEDTEKLIVCNSRAELDAALIAKCREQFEAGIDLYKVTMEIDVIALENTEEYKDFKDVVRVSLGDMVKCHNRRLDISTQARAIKITWDCIVDSIKSVVLGDYEYDVFDSWSSSVKKIESIINKDGSVMAEKVQGVLDGIRTQLKIQSTAAQKQEARAILFEDLDPDSALYGAMALGTKGLQISDKRTADGRDWEWSTAFTAKGGYADVIIAGILSDKTGKSFWNMNTGKLQLCGIFSQETEAGVKSVEIKNNQVDFYAWNDNGNFVGAIGAIKTSERVGLSTWIDKEDMYTIGYLFTDDEGVNRVQTILKIDGRTCDESTPWIANTASGRLFKNNPGGGIVVENGFIKTWNMQAVGDATMFPNNSGGGVSVKDGLVTGWGLNVASGTLFPDNSGGGIKVGSGLIEDWGLETATGTLFSGNKGGGIKVGNGLIEDWDLQTYTGSINVMCGLVCTQYEQATKILGVNYVTLNFTNGLLESVSYGEHDL